MNRAGTVVPALDATHPVLHVEPPPETTTPGLLLNTTPVGAPGTVTMSETLAPVLPLYSVERPLPLSATHQGEVALETRPQALTSAVSTRSADTAPSDTRLCCA